MPGQASTPGDQAAPVTAAAFGWGGLWSFLASGIVLFTGTVLLLPSDVYPARQRIGPQTNILDTSWNLELPVRLTRGELAGRDFISNAGPLWQLMHAAGDLVPSGDLASIHRFSRVPEAVLTAIGVWLLLRVTGAPWAWRVFTYLAWASVFNKPAVTVNFNKSIFVLLVVVVCARTLVGDGRPREKWYGQIGSLLPWCAAGPFMVMYTVDVGVFTLLTLLGVCAVVGCCTWSLPHVLVGAVRWRAGTSCAAMLLSFTLFAAFLAWTSGWRRYLPDSWALMRGYGVQLALGGQPSDFLRLAAGAASAAAMMVFGAYRLRVAWRDRSSNGSRELALLAVACLSLVYTRYGVTRTEPLHVYVALAPIVFLLLCFLPCYCWTEWPRLRWLSLLIWPLGLALAPVGTLSEFIDGTKHRILAVRTTDLSAARLVIDHVDLRNATALAKTLPERSMSIWPYETIVPLLAGKVSPDYTVQSILAVNETLENATIEKMRAVPGLPVVLSTEPGLVDDVENLTRMPRIFRYLLESYELTTPPHRGFAILRPVEPAPRAWQELELPIAIGHFRPADQPAFEVVFPDDSCRASDLIVLRLRAVKTPLFGIGKPGRLIATFRLSSGDSRRRVLLLAPDGATHDVLTSACTMRDPLFASCFSPGRCWRSTERVSALRIEWQPLDFLSRRPQQISLERAAVLLRAGVETRESPIAKQWDQSLWNWCFERPAEHL